MASVGSTSSFYSALVSQNKGIGGLASGLDTDTLIETLTMATRSKIAKQGQQKQLAQWKQDAYRTATTALSAFRDKWFTTTGTSTSQNILTSSFYSTFKATTSSSKVSVTAGSGSVTGDIKIDSIKQLATAHSIGSSSAVEKELAGTEIDFDDSFAGKTLSLNVGGVVKNIKLDSLEGVKTDATGFKNELQRLVDSAYGQTSGGQSVVKVDLADLGSGKYGLQISNDSGKVTVAASNSALGLESGMSNRITTSTTTVGELLGSSNLSGDTYKFDINGVEITAKATDTMSALMTSINNSTAGVRISYSDITGAFEMVSKTTGVSGQIEINDVEGNLMNLLFGAKSASSIKSDALMAGGAAINFENAKSIQGGAVFDDDFRLTDGQVFEYELTIDGSSQSIKVEINESDLENLEDDGESHATFLLNKLNEEIYTKFPEAGFENSEGKGLLVAFENKDGNIQLTTDTSLNVTLKATDATGQSGTEDILGFKTSEESNINTVASTTKLADVGIAGSGTLSFTIAGEADTIDVAYNSDESIEDLLTRINENAGLKSAGISMKIEDGSLVLDGGYKAVTVSDSNTDDGLMESMFGVSGFETKLESLTTVTKAQNAEIVLFVGDQKRTVTSATNTFDINGAKVEVLAETAPDEAAININVSRDADALIKKLEDFVADYNALITTLGQMVSQKASGDYPPLTDEQKEEMTQEQIDKWEIEAKKGMLHNDSIINGIMQSLRDTIYTEVGDNKNALYKIGIESASLVTAAGTVDTSKNGTLVINADKLKETILNNPDAVRDLFTNLEGGIGKKMDEIIDRAVNTSSLPEKRGSLINVAGTAKLTGDNTSTLGNKIDAYDTAIARLQTQLEKEYNRYWKQFSSLDTALQRLSMQSSWFDSFGA